MCKCITTIYGIRTDTHQPSTSVLIPLFSCVTMLNGQR
jgi:hypothetical protein